MQLLKPFSFCVIALTFGVVVAGCRSSASTQSESQILIDTDAAFARAAVASGTARAFRKYAAPDAMALPQGANPVRGRDQIFQSMLPDSGQLTWTPRGADLSKSGDLGYTWGEYQYRAFETNGIGAIRYGKYLTIWKKQPDHSWRFVTDIGNSSPPPK